MGPVESISVCLFKKYSKLDDRASRSEYWWFCLFSVIIHLFINFCLFFDMSHNEEPMVHHVAYIVVAVLLLLPWYSVGMRRMHDAGYSETLGNLGVFSTFFVIYFTSIALFVGNFYPPDEVFISIVILFLICCAMAFAFIIFAATPGTPADNEYGPNPLLIDGNNSYFQDIQYQSPQDYSYIEAQNSPYPSLSQMQPMQGQGQNQEQEQGQEQEQVQPNYMAQVPLFDDIPQVNLTAEELQNLGFSKVNESEPQDKQQDKHQDS